MIHAYARLLFCTTRQSLIHFDSCTINAFISRNDTIHANAGASLPIRIFCSIPLNASPYPRSGPRLCDSARHASSSPIHSGLNAIWARWCAGISTPMTGRPVILAAVQKSLTLSK